MIFIPSNVNICNMKINSPDHGSAVNLGSSFLKGINVVGKKNQGFGQQLGNDSVTVVPIHMIQDDDTIDSTSIKINCP